MSIEEIKKTTIVYIVVLDYEDSTIYIYDSVPIEQSNDTDLTDEVERWLNNNNHTDISFMFDTEKMTIKWKGV